MSVKSNFASPKWSNIESIKLLFISSLTEYTSWSLLAVSLPPVVFDDEVVTSESITVSVPSVAAISEADSESDVSVLSYSFTSNDLASSTTLAKKVKTISYDGKLVCLLWSCIKIAMTVPM